jgi:ribonuclease BN (tRNA processing enzyme)
LLKNTLDYGKFKPNNFKIIKLKKFRLRNLSIVPFKVLHSLKCDSVGFKIILKKFSIIYTGDVLNIPNKKILEGVDYYIGDGSSIRANLIRRKGNKKFGHARITTQIEWCKNAGIKNIIFTHLGKETIKYEKVKIGMA